MNNYIVYIPRAQSIELDILGLKYISFNHTSDFRLVVPTCWQTHYHARIHACMMHASFRVGTGKRQSPSDVYSPSPIWSLLRTLQAHTLGTSCAWTPAANIWGLPRVQIRHLRQMKGIRAALDATLNANCKQRSSVHLNPAFSVRETRGQSRHQILN
jgi:hypothetical protein